MPKWMRNWIDRLQDYVGRWWYAPLIGLLAAADSFVIIVPTDGLLVSACMLAPRRWLYTAICVSLGSTVGSWLLAAILEKQGLPFLLQIQPGVDQLAVWQWTDQMMDKWGLWTLFLVAVSPLMQHPAVALAALANMPLGQIFTVVLLGRSIKYLFLSRVSTKAPHLLEKLWGIKDDLDEVGITKKNNPSP